ncbi:MAG: hypothetical protein GY792_07555 [Gammaproteobacteria bacterium]|nr:hypothetical protein [Gammaproteobacteria bacterium]
MIEKSESNQLSLATAPILGQAPSGSFTDEIRKQRGRWIAASLFAIF